MNNKAYLCGMHMLRTTQAKATTKVVKKFGNKISVSNSYLKGTFSIKNYRQYTHLDEVDIIFEGFIYVNYNRKKEWYSSSVMTDVFPNGGKVSKIKVNRFIRRNIFFDVKTYLKYFDIELPYYDLIKKIIWK